MSDSMAKQNKVKINATVSKPIVDKARGLAGDNLSNFVETAMVYYIGALDKEKEIKLKAVEEQLRAKEEGERDLVAVLLRLITNHPELINEYNDLRKKKPVDHENTKTITFFDD